MTPNNPPLQSLWGSLSQRLLCSIFPVAPNINGDGKVTGWAAIPDAPTVVAPLLEGTRQIQAQWNSQFESINASQASPLLTGLVQSGQAEASLDALVELRARVGQAADGASGGAVSAGLGAVGIDVDQLGGSVSDGVRGTLRSLRGASTLTRLNSTQVFAGAPPIKLPLTLMFRAWADPRVEVETPVDQLIQWSLPQELADTDFFQGSARAQSIEDVLKVFFPSRAPQIIGIRYNGWALMPCVIEDISDPIVAPIDSTGGRLEVKVQLAISTLSALGMNDWNSIPKLGR